MIKRLISSLISSLTHLPAVMNHSTLEFTVASCLAHLCFMIIPLSSGPSHHLIYASIAFTLTSWLIGVKRRSPLLLICFTPTGWISTLRWWRMDILGEPLNPERAIKLNEDIALTLGDVTPTLELSIGVIALGLYLVSTLIWLREGEVELLSAPHQQHTSAELLERLAIIDRVSALSLEVKLLIYWCVATPIAILAWSAQSPIPEAIETYRDLYESIARLWFISLISITIGVSWVLLRLTPPALLYLVTLDQYRLSRAWRARAWVLLALGALCVTLSL